MNKKKAALYFLIFNLLFFLISSPFVILYGPFQSIKLVTVGTILTSRHPQVLEFFLTQEKINDITKLYNNTIIVEPVIHTKESIIIDDKNGLRLENIQGKYFKGKVMLVNDSSQIKVAVTKEIGIAGQRLSEMVLDNQAIAGINGGGFYDPNAQGNGAFPDGITIQEGKIVHNNTNDDTEVNIIGFDNEDRLILKNMNNSQVYANNIKNAVTFYPNLILDNKPLIQGDGGWGIAPRTGIGQKADGTVILVVIDGRQPSWSMGATLRDLMNVFIEYGAVNAANLDGGSSTEMIYDGQVINSLWNIFGERYIPTSFIVLPNN